MKTQTHVIRRGWRKLLRTLGPPTFPFFMVIGASILRTIGPYIPFLKYARVDRFSYHMPPVYSEIYQRFYENIVNWGLGRHWSPHAITLAVTSDCNLKCIHCSAFRRDTSNSLTTEEWLDVIDQCAELGMTDLIITGGEPFMRPDLDVLIKRIVDNNCVPDMFTNGTMLTDENLRKVKDAGCDTLFVSIDSPCENEHDVLRGREGAWKKAVEGIRRAVEMGMQVGLSTYLGEEQIDKEYQRQYVEMCKELGVKEITIFDLVPTGKLIKHDEILLSPASREKGRKVHEHQWMDRKGPRVSAMSNVNDPHILGCFGVRWQIHITHNGYVTPCDFNPLYWGNVREEPLRDILERMKLHPEYDRNTMTCRIQDPEFRRKYIHNIPDGATLPYPIEKIDPMHRAIDEAAENSEVVTENLDLGKESA
ncbi:MAG: radical SAM protein [Actinobacteria bacterium]|nr:radical SAM protein [Actinomycetota bacterium]